MREALVSLDETDFEALGIDALVELCRAAGITTFEELVCDGTGSVVEVGVEERLDADRLDALEYVTEWDLLTETDDEWLYLVAFEAPALSEEITEPMENLVGTCGPELRGLAATLSLVGDQADIAATMDSYEPDGVRPRLRRLSGYDGPQRSLEELTDRQQEVIQTAWNMGYYEVPRAVSTDEVANELGLDGSAVAETSSGRSRTSSRHISLAGELGFSIIYVSWKMWVSLSRMVLDTVMGLSPVS